MLCLRSKRISGQNIILPDLSQCQTCHPTPGSWTDSDPPWSFSASASVCGARTAASRQAGWRGWLHMPSLQTSVKQNLGAEVRTAHRSMGWCSMLWEMLHHWSKEGARLTDQPPCRSLDAFHPWNISGFQGPNNRAFHKALIIAKDKADWLNELTNHN